MARLRRHNLPAEGDPDGAMDRHQKKRSGGTTGDSPDRRVLDLVGRLRLRGCPFRGWWRPGHRPGGDTREVTTGRICSSTRAELFALRADMAGRASPDRHLYRLDGGAGSPPEQPCDPEISGSHGYMARPVTYWRVQTARLHSLGAGPLRAPRQRTRPTPPSSPRKPAPSTKAVRRSAMAAWTDGALPCLQRRGGWSAAAAQCWRAAAWRAWPPSTRRRRTCRTAALVAGFCAQLRHLIRPPIMGGPEGTTTTRRDIVE